MGQDLTWKYIASIYLKQRHVLVLRNEDYAMQLQVVSRVNAPSKPSKKLYFVDGDARAFSTEAEALAASELGPSEENAGIHPRFIICSPQKESLGQLQRVSGNPRLPSLVVQAERHARFILRRLTVAMHGLVKAYRLSAHPPSGR